LFGSALGLPLIAGFVGEFCALLAAWHFHPSAWPAAGQVFTMIAAGSLILVAGYMCWTIYRIFLVPKVYPIPLDDLDGREGLILAALAVVVVLLGIWPMLIFDWLDPTVIGLVQALAQATGS
jgi:NADH-quinone oxidoreductase subunit M